MGLISAQANARVSGTRGILHPGHARWAMVGVGGGLEYPPSLSCEDTSPDGASPHSECALNHGLLRPFRAWIGCGRANPGRCPGLACVAPLALSGHARPRRIGAVAWVGWWISMGTPSLEPNPNGGEMFFLMAPRLCVSAGGSSSVVSCGQRCHGNVSGRSSRYMERSRPPRR